MSEKLPKELFKQYENRIIEILKDADLDTISAKKVRHQLESEFSTSVAPYKKELDENIVHHFKNMRNHQYDASSTLEAHRGNSKKKPIKSESSDSSLENESKKAKVETSVKKKPKKKKSSSTQDGPKALSGIALPKKLSPILSEILSRLEVSKYLWVYIKKHKLQDPTNGRVILCDAKLKELFGVDQLTMFEMSKLIGPHLFDCPQEELEAYKTKFNIPTNPQVTD